MSNSFVLIFEKSVIIAIILNEIFFMAPLLPNTCFFLIAMNNNKVVFNVYEAMIK